MSLARHAAIVLAALATGVLAPSALAAPVELVTVGTFASPTYVTGAPGDARRLYVVERAGAIKVLRDGVSRPFADLSSLVSESGERGLYSIAFAPDFAASRRLYAFFTANNGDLVVARLTAQDADTAGAAAPVEILRIPHDRQENHNGGQLQFGPDGLLYASTGDGGGGDDPAGNGQNLSSRDPAVVNGVNRDPFLGKLLRLDAAPATPAPPQIYAYGLRNPYRFSFDARTGDLLLGDVGQDAREEVNVVPAGAPPGTNFGWSAWEGTADGPAAGTAARDGFTFPVLEYGHFGRSFGSGLGEGCSITGGYVARDPELPELAGQYLYADFCVPGVRAVDLAAVGTTDRRLALPGLAPGAIVSFGQDACDRVHVVSDSGAVQRLSSGGGCTLRGASTPTPSAPGAPPAPSVAAADRRAPVVRLRGRRAQRVIALGRLRLAVGCDEQCDLRVRGQFLLGAGRPKATPALALGARRVRLDAGARVSLDLRPTARTRRAVARSLRRGRAVVARVELQVSDAAGNARTTVARIRVRR